MKKPLVALLITHLLMGCYTFKPVSRMSDWQLQQEYLDVQYKLSAQQTKYYNPPIYTTTGYIKDYAGVASQLVPYPSVFNYAILNTVSAGEKVKLQDDIATLSKRLSELGLEMSKRGIYSP